MLPLQLVVVVSWRGRQLPVFPKVDQLQDPINVGAAKGHLDVPILRIRASNHCTGVNHVDVNRSMNPSQRLFLQSDVYNPSCCPAIGGVETGWDKVDFLNEIRVYHLIKSAKVIQQHKRQLI